MNKRESLLLKGLLNGDKDPVREIYTTLFPKIQKFVLQNNGNREDAEDVFQKSLLQFITRVKLKGVPEINSLDAYLFTINKNLWRKELISRNRVTNLSVTEHTSEGIGKDTHKIMNRIVQREAEKDAVDFLEFERWELFRECFALLSENCRQVLDFFFRKKPYSDFPEEFGYSSETVARQRVFKCKAKLINLVKSHSDFKKLLKL